MSPTPPATWIVALERSLPTCGSPTPTANTPKKPMSALVPCVPRKSFAHGHSRPPTRCSPTGDAAVVRPLSRFSGLGRERSRATVPAAAAARPKPGTSGGRCCCPRRLPTRAPRGWPPPRPSPRPTARRPQGFGSAYERVSSGGTRGVRTACGFVLDEELPTPRTSAGRATGEEDMQDPKRS